MGFSTDGINWTSATSGTNYSSEQYQDATYGDGMWAITGTNNTNGNSVTYYTSNRTSWTKSSANNLGGKSIGYGDGTWVIVDSDGATIQSTDDISSFSLTPGQPPQGDYQGIIYSFGRWILGTRANATNQASMWQSVFAGNPGTILTLTDTTDLARFTPGDVVQGGGTLNTTVTGGPWQGSQSATTVSQVISIGGNMNTNYSGNYAWSTIVFNPPLQGSEFKFYVEAGCTVRNDSNNQLATASSTGNLVVPDDGTGLLSSVSFSVTNGQGGVTGPYVDGVLTTNAVEVDTLTATASYGIPVAATVVSTNLATPSITTDGGSWSGTDGTSSGNVALRETKVTGPIQTTEVAGPYLTLSSSSGRWLVTESDYNTSLKLNKFVKASSLQSVASLFTVMDNSGNITDLSLEDPGYTPMVGDPTYTTTFPSIFPSGQTPDVELPPGTKYQVEVKATNTFGTDTKVSNDVMPVAGLLQTSVITASEVANYSNTSNWETIGTATVGNAPQNAFDGSVTTFNTMLGSDADLQNVLTGTKIPLNLINVTKLNVTKLEIYIGRGGTAGGPDIQTCINNDNSNFYENPTGTLGWQDISSLLTASAPTGVVANIVVNLDLYNGEGFDLYAIRANGVILIDGAITLTTTDNTNYNLFSAGDAVVESSGGTPVTSAITNVRLLIPLLNTNGTSTQYRISNTRLKQTMPLMETLPPALAL